GAFHPLPSLGVSLHFMEPGPDDPGERVARVLGGSRAARPTAQPSLTRAASPPEDAGNEPCGGPRGNWIPSPPWLGEAGARERDGEGGFRPGRLSKPASEQRTNERVDDRGVEHAVEPVAAV